jgi:hypothetical protein
MYIPKHVFSALLLQVIERKYMYVGFEMNLLKFKIYIFNIYYYIYMYVIIYIIIYLYNIFKI